MRTQRPGGTGGAGEVSINLEQMQALVRALEAAGKDLPNAKSAADSVLSDAMLSTSATGGVSAIARWVDDQLAPTRRRLAIAQSLAASHPGIKQVHFDASAIPSATPAQARARADKAVKLLKDPDPKNLAALKKLLSENGIDPYFASRFARRTGPKDYEKFVRAISPPSINDDYPDGVTAHTYHEFTSLLGSTLGLATRGSGDLALPPSWTRHYVRMMVDPISRDETSVQKRSDVWFGRSALSLLMSRGRFSTAFLKDATRAIGKVAEGGQYARPFLTDEHGNVQPGYVPVDPNGQPPILGANGKPFTDPVIALMGALAQNPKAANWAFTQGGTTDFPLPRDGKDASTPVNSFLATILTKHQWFHANDMKTVMVAVRAGALFDPDSSVGTSIHNFIRSQKQQKYVWDHTPWYDKWGHLILDGLSLLALAIPVPGVDVAVSGGLQAANAAWYGVQGDWTNAGLSAVGTVFSGLGVVGALRAGGETLAALTTVDRFGQEIPETADAYAALKTAKQLEPGVYEFKDATQLGKAIDAAQPNVTYVVGDLKYFTDDSGAVSKLQIYVDGKWIDTSLNKGHLSTIVRKNGADVWDLDGLPRGVVIEDALAHTEYADWTHIGAWDHGKFPTADFADGDHVVSLKTFHPNPDKNSIPTNIKKNIEQLKDAVENGYIVGKGREYGGVKSAELDLRVPSGEENLPVISRIKNLCEDRKIKFHLDIY